MTLRVIKAGLSASLQDKGRDGLLDRGVPPSGALDPLLLAIANRLAGNQTGEACIELIGPGTVLEVLNHETRIALAGEMALRIDGEAKASWRSHLLKPGQRIDLAAPKHMRAGYLAVAGGFDPAPQLGSRSTLAKAGLGTILQDGIDLPLRDKTPPAGPDRILPNPDLSNDGQLRVILGPEEKSFTPQAIDDFLQADWRVSAQSDRMGLRLSGPGLAHAKGADIPTGGILKGCIQVPGSGQPILMLCDHQTTGGYAKIACVISADLSKAGRLSPGQALCFKPVTWQEARAALIQARENEERLLASIRLLEADGSEALLSANLVSGMVDALDWDDDA